MYLFWLALYCLCWVAANARNKQCTCAYYNMFTFESLANVYTANTTDFVLFEWHTTFVTVNYNRTRNLGTVTHVHDKRYYTILYNTEHSLCRPIPSLVWLWMIISIILLEYNQKDGQVSYIDFHRDFTIVQKSHFAGHQLLARRLTRRNRRLCLFNLPMLFDSLTVIVLRKNIKDQCEPWW